MEDKQKRKAGAHGLSAAEKAAGVLRRKAESIALDRESVPAAPWPGADDSIEAILHELLVHQIELELQNEELRAAQTQVEEARARYFDLYNLAPVGYMVLSRKGIILEANISAASILGLAKQEILKRPFNHFIFREDQDPYYLRNRSLFATLEPQVFELRTVRSDGQVRWVQLTETAAETTGSDVVSRTVMIDVTDRKEAEEKVRLAEERAMALVAALQRADQNKNKFLNVLSHELRNPLAAITMGLALLDRVQPGCDAAKRAGEALKRQTAQLTHLVDDLLDITRITQNKVSLKKKPVELVELVQKVAHDFQPAFTTKGVELATHWPDATIQLEADPVRLIQAIGNLLHNALKFTDAGGKVTLDLFTAGLPDNLTEAVLQVTDTGAGMTPELQRELFQPFVQADNTLNRGLGGLGLGLVVVKGMIEMHGGHVNAASEGLGKGSRFSLHLPIEPKENDSDEDKPALQPVAVQPLRILIIEDNADLRQILTELMNLHGHETAAAGTGVDGIACAATYVPDVVICDIGLPGLSGYEVARSLSQNDRKRPFLIAMSGYAQPEDIARSKAAGFDRHIPKPVELAVLEQMLSEAAAY